MGMLLTVSAIKIGTELMFKEQSYYDMIDVLPGAPSSELKKGYKRASLKVHPDKLQAASNIGGEADDDASSNDEAFVALKAAYDVLSDSQLRDMYDKFGKPGIEYKDDTTNLLAGLGFFYVMWLCLAFLLTRRRTVNRAQTWSFTGLLALAIFEYQACILSFDFLQDALPQLAMFEKIELLHRIYPAYLLASRMIAWLFFEDVDAHNFVMLQHLHWKIDRLRERLLFVAADGGGANKAAEIAAVTAAGSTTPEMWAALADANAKAATGLTLRGTQPGLPAAEGTEGMATDQGAGAGASSIGSPPPPPGGGLPAPPRAAAKQGGGRSLTSLVWFFGVYFFFQWLLGRGS
jgi:hypothetical protein